MKLDIIRRCSHKQGIVPVRPTNGRQRAATIRARDRARLIVLDAVRTFDRLVDWSVGESRSQEDHWVGISQLFHGDELCAGVTGRRNHAVGIKDEGESLGLDIGVEGEVGEADALVADVAVETAIDSAVWYTVRAEDVVISV